MPLVEQGAFISVISGFFGMLIPLSERPGKDAQASFRSLSPFYFSLHQTQKLSLPNPNPSTFIQS